VKRLYAACGYDEPLVMHFDSPMQCLLAINILQGLGELKEVNLWENLRENLMVNLMENLGENLWGNLMENLWENLGVNLWENLGENLWGNLMGNLMGNLRGNLMENLMENLGENLGENLMGNLRENLMDNLIENLMVNLMENLRADLMENLRGNLRENLGENLWGNTKYIHTYFWGGMDAYWLAWAEFAAKIGVPIEKAEHFHAYIQFAKTSGVSYFYPGFAFVSDRPDVIRKDDETRMHCEGGPALSYRDGYAVHCWHGQNIPSEWIEKPETLTAAIAINHPNVEQRRAACEILGWARVLDELNAAVIDKDPDPEIGSLLEVDIPDIGREKFIRVTCGTGREFAIPVPPEMTTALQAQAWMVGLEPSDFMKPEIRT